jgi:hypothetical protein
LLITLAIVQFVVAASCLCAAGTSGLSAALTWKPQNEVTFQQHRLWDEQVPLWRPYRVVNIVLPVIVCIALVTCGVGLLLLQWWAHFGSLCISLFLLVRHLVDVLYCAVFVLPASNRYFDQALAPQIRASAQGDPESVATAARFGFLVTNGDLPALGADCFGILFALVSLAVLVRTSVREACWSRRPHYPEYDDF